MQAKYTVALALGAGFALGAGAIHGLHAAAAPPAYVISEIEVQDEGGYKNDFLPGAQKALLDRGRHHVRVLLVEFLHWIGAHRISLT